MVQRLSILSNIHKAFVLVAGLALSLHLLAVRTDAETLNFYPRNSAISPYGSNLAEVTGDGRFEFFPGYGRKADKPSAALKREIASGESIAEPAQGAVDDAGSEREKIIGEFGNPEESLKMRVNAEAPAPFKAMVAALNLGDDELALAYGRQYVRYLRTIQETTDEIMDVLGPAMQAEGMAEQEPWETSGRFEKYAAAVKASRAQLQTERARVERLDSRAAAILKQAGLDQQLVETASQQQSSEPDVAKREFDERTARLEVRRAIGRRAPVDIYGEVDVYFFFRSQDKNSILMLQEIEQFQQKTATGQKVRLMGLSLDRISNDELAAFRKQHAVSFPIKPGAAMAKKLVLKGYPTTVIVARNSGKAVYEEGFRRFFYLDELVKIMRGR